MMCTLVSAMFPDDMGECKKVRLIFPSTADLLEFVQVSALHEVEIDVDTRSLTGICATKTIRQAIIKYRAKVFAEG